jgi:transmembrane sensor
MKRAFSEHTDIDELIIIYFSGKLTSGQLKDLKYWINTSPENKKYFLKMREAWFSTISASEIKRFNKDIAYKNFLIRTGKVQRNSKRSVLFHIIRISAAAVALLLIALFSYRQGSNQVKNQFTNIVMESPLGSRTKIYLPDSTLVWLNAGSKITYSQGFGVNERKIHLSGEGYFEVTKNEKLPMQVVTNELIVEVLGTTFNFRNYPEDEEIIVSLEKGKIISKNQLKSGDYYTLFPNQKVILNKKTKTMLLSSVIFKNTSGWKDGGLFFDELLLPDIIKTLERSYNVHIRVADDSLNNYRFYGYFTRTENTIRDVLDRLAGTNKLRYIMKDSEIILIPNKKN